MVRDLQSLRFIIILFFLSFCLNKIKTEGLIHLTNERGSRLILLVFEHSRASILKKGGTTNFRPLQAEVFLYPAINDNNL